MDLDKLYGFVTLHSVMHVCLCYFNAGMLLFHMHECMYLSIECCVCVCGVCVCACYCLVVNHMEGTVLCVIQQAAC